MKKYKIKTNAAAKKRFKKTKTKGILHKKSNKAHLLEKKTSTRKRSLKRAKSIPLVQLKEIKKMLGLN